MFTEESRKLVKQAIKEETINARKYGNCYASVHEGYAIAAEEVDEVVEMAKAVEVYLKSFWEDVKHNEDPLHHIKTMKNSAFYCALECLQVCTCCNKLLGEEV